MNTLLLIGIVLIMILSFVLSKKYVDAKDAATIVGEVVYSNDNGSFVETGYRFEEFCFIKDKCKEGEIIWVFDRKFVEKEKKKDNLYLALHPFKTRRLLNQSLYFDEYVCSDSASAVNLTLKKRVKKTWFAEDAEGNLVFLLNAPEETVAGDVVSAQKLAFSKQIAVSTKV